MVVLWGIWAPLGSLDSFNFFFLLFVWLLGEVEVHWQHVTNKTKQSEFDTVNGCGKHSSSGSPPRFPKHVTFMHIIAFTELTEILSW